MTDHATKRIRIAILLGAPLTEQNFERIGIPYLSPCFDVIVFDCVPWLGRNTDGRERPNILWKNCATIRSEPDLELAVKEYEPGYAIDFVGLGAYTGRIQKVLAQSKVKFVVQKLGSLPVPRAMDRARAFLFDREALSKQAPGANGTLASSEASGRPMPWQEAGRSINRVVVKMKELIAVGRDAMAPDICLLAGNKSLDSFTRRASQILWVGSNDFHQFNAIKRDWESGANPGAKGPFILFIDDCLPSASDWELLNMSPPVTATAYYPALRSFFDRIESHYRLPVVIAGHPNAKSDGGFPSEMGGRTVVFGETASLTLQSHLVLVHGSSAISFAVLGRKPALFLTTRELDKSRFGLHVRNMARTLGSPLVFMDKVESAAFGPQTPAYNESKYQRYECDYLKNELSTETQPWQTFIAHVLAERCPAS
jgi:hypothetical protein